MTKIEQRSRDLEEEEPVGSQGKAVSDNCEINYGVKCKTPRREVKSTGSLLRSCLDKIKNVDSGNLAHSMDLLLDYVYCSNNYVRNYFYLRDVK